MADEMYAFLDLKGVTGSSLDADFKNQIPIQSLSWGVTNHSNFGDGSGGSKHRGHIHELHISKIMCKATPTLMQFCTMGDHISEGTLSLCWQSGDTKKAYYEVKLKNIMVCSHQMAGSGGAQHPMESITLRFAQMHSTYNPQDNEGSAGGGIEFGWDLQENKKA
jgi:type VI secretion system secreted protein Hcp